MSNTFITNPLLVVELILALSQTCAARATVYRAALSRLVARGELRERASRTDTAAYMYTQDMHQPTHPSIFGALESHDRTQLPWKRDVSATSSRVTVICGNEAAEV